MQALFVFVLLVPFIYGYDEKFDKMDVDKILADEKLFNAYIDCLLDRAECTVEHSSDIKELLPEVIQTACGKCSAIQRSHMRKSVKAIQNNKPAEFEEFRKKYDPKGEHDDNFAAFLMGTD